MAIYAVHSPALVGDPAAAFERAKVLRLGFAAWGFVFAPLWLLSKRLWLALGAWILARRSWASRSRSASCGRRQASSLRTRCSVHRDRRPRLAGLGLGPARLPLADIVAAADPESAEREFLARALAAPARGAASAGPAPPSAHEIIGLFPRAGR